MEMLGDCSLVLRGINMCYLLHADRKVPSAFTGDGAHSCLVVRPGADRGKIIL